MNPVVVIGAGLAGLSAACYLTGRGYDVTVVEREELPGGRACILRQDRFTFDSGPTVLTMPDLIADAVRAASRDPAANLHELMPSCSTLYVLEPVPNLGSKINWSTEAQPLRDRMHAFLDTHGYPCEVITEHLVTPLDWQAQGMAAGTPFALAHTFAQTGPFRPSKVERRLPGMFFAGSGTVPGVGVPMVLISGKLAASRVTTYLREQAR
jgi:phytoene desaturase